MNVTSDSRKVQPGDIYVAVKGTASDGHSYVRMAQEAGATLIIGERPWGPEWLSEVTVPYIRVPDSRETLATLAAQQYKNPSLALKVIGITGTSGKTTTAFFIESILESAGWKVGLIGTIEIRDGKHSQPADYTTPGPVELQELLARMRANGCDAVVMEVSSHALKQKRCDSIAFDAAVFLNLTPEHLDYHSDMKDYFFSKARLFRDLGEFSVGAGKKPAAIVSGDQPEGLEILEELPMGVVPVCFRSELQEFDSSREGIKGFYKGLPLESKLVGDFNISNMIAAVEVGRALGIQEGFIQSGIKNLHSVPGRLEKVPTTSQVDVWVDYCHKPDALEKALLTLLGFKKKGQRLITVFGCGGDRDRQKRPTMGKIAAQHSDAVWITSDNPRTESPEAIIQQIFDGVDEEARYRCQIEPDRHKAIFQSIQFAGAGDLVLIAGKGHEDYQIIGTKKFPFDDRTVSKEALRIFHESKA